MTAPRDNSVRPAPRQRGPRKHERRERDRERSAAQAALAERFARGEYTQAEREMLERGRSAVEMIVSGWDDPEWTDTEGGS